MFPRFHSLLPFSLYMYVLSLPPPLRLLDKGSPDANAHTAEAQLRSTHPSPSCPLTSAFLSFFHLVSRLLDEGSPDAKAQSAEALLQLATHEPVRCRLMARGGAVGALAGVLSDPKRTPAGALWAARLLRVLSEVRVGVGKWSCGTGGWGYAHACMLVCLCRVRVWVGVLRVLGEGCEGECVCAGAVMVQQSS